MVNSTILFMMAAPPGGGGGSGSMMQTFGFMALIFVVFWFFMIRPQRQKQKQRTAMLNALKKGDSVATIGGIQGTVTKVSEKFVTVKVDDSCKINFSRSSIAEVLIVDDKKVPVVEETASPEKKEEGAL